MAIPNTARTRLISGIPGNISHDGPTRVMTAILNSATESNNVFGRAFTYKDDSVEDVQAGGSNAFAGIMINPKAYTIDTENAKNGTTAELLTMGEVYVQLAATGDIGDSVSFDPATGILSAGTTGIVIQGASIARHKPSAETPNLAVISLNGFMPASAGGNGGGE